MAYDGRLPALKLGRSPKAPLRFDAAELEAWLYERTPTMTPRVVPRTESPEYLPGGPNSYFRDLARSAAQRHFEDAAALDPALADPETARWRSALGRLVDPFPESECYDGGVEEARARLGALRTIERRVLVHGFEQRDVTSADPGASGFIPTGAPAHIGEEFAVAVRAQARRAAALRQVPLPQAGKDVTVPRLTTGTSAAVQASEAAAPSETDFDAESPTVRSPKAWIVGQSDVSVQAVDFSDPMLDTVLAADLGRALGAQLDAQILLGAASSDETRGLLNWSGINSLNVPTRWLRASEAVCLERYGRAPADILESARGGGVRTPGGDRCRALSYEFPVFLVVFVRVRIPRHDRVGVVVH